MSFDNDSFLLFSDVRANTIYRWDRFNGITTFLEHSGLDSYLVSDPQSPVEPGANGIVVDRSSGLIYMCEHGRRRISVLNRSMSRITLVDNYRGRRFNSPNDIVFAKNGDLYFSDPPYGLPTENADSYRELEFSGVYRIPNKVLHPIIADGTNGKWLLYQL